MVGVVIIVVGSVDSSNTAVKGCIRTHSIGILGE